MTDAELAFLEAASIVTFEPFQKVLVRDNDIAYWGIDFFEDYAETLEHPYICLTNSYKQCLPYNDETKHLLGTDNSPTPPEPEFRWGDHVEVRDDETASWRKAVFLSVNKGAYYCVIQPAGTCLWKYCRHADW